jgi:regulator of telomere elongation helicase 1
VLAEAQVKTSTYEDFISNLRDAITMYEGMYLNLTFLTLEAYSSGKHVATGLKSFVDIIQHVFDPDSNQDLFADSFRLFLSIDRKIPQIRAEVKEMYSEALSDRDKRMKISERSIGFWCFNPGLALLNLRKDKPHAFILTSGTLSPMDSFAYELGM